MPNNPQTIPLYKRYITAPFLPPFLSQKHNIISVCRKTDIILKKGAFSVACSAGFASCKTFGKQPKRPCFGRSPKQGEGGSPISAPSHGEGVFRQGCRNKDTPSFKHGCLQVVEQSRCRTHRQQTTTIAETQSHQSVLKGIGIINQKFISKTDFSYPIS